MQDKTVSSDVEQARRGVMAQLAAVYPPDHAGDERRSKILARIALVERGRDGYWITTHDTAADAAHYWETQDSRDDWGPVGTCNLDTGEFSIAHLALSFIVSDSKNFLLPDA